MLVWLRRDAWGLESVEEVSGEEFAAKYWHKPGWLTLTAPDNRRFLTDRHDEWLESDAWGAEREDTGCIRKADPNQKSVPCLFDFKTHTYIYSFDFLPEKVTWLIGLSDNDHARFFTVENESGHVAHPVIYSATRRFPEWWWGHFYRPEVWLASILAVLMFREIFRMRKFPRESSASRAFSWRLQRPGAKLTSHA